MGGVLNALGTVSQSMEVFQKAIRTTSNNVTNAGTPGYVRQRVAMVSKAMHLEFGTAGGVADAGLVSSRNDYLERDVWGQAHGFGRESQRTRSLEEVEGLFDVTGETGVGGGLNRLFASFSQWSVSPNSTAAREDVLRRADDLAGAFRGLSGSIGSARSRQFGELRSVAEAINAIGERLQSYNAELRQDIRRQDDPGLTANIHASLEELAELTDFSVLRGEGGTVSVLLGGQSPLTLGANRYPVRVEDEGGQAVIRDSEGRDISGQFRGGRVRALLDTHNRDLPELRGQLDQLAIGVAEKVNQRLATGVDANGQPGAALFAYDVSLGAAASLRVTGITPSQLAAASTAAPGGNTNALDLAALASSREIDGQTFAQFFGGVAARVGHAVASARDEEHSKSLLLSQSRSLRAELTSVSLDEEAANLVEFQRAYEASAEVIRILNSLTETTLNLLR